MAKRKSNVEQLADVYNGAVERWFDRWQAAIKHTRVAKYPYERLGADVLESWIDGAHALAFPWALLGGCEIKVPPPFFVERLVVDATKADVFAVLPIARLPVGTASAVSDDLAHESDPKGLIAAKYVDVRLVKDDYAVVKLFDLGKVPTSPAGLYRALIRAKPDDEAIAGIEVLWPG